MTRKPFPPSICSCMATELLRSSTKKANRVALHVKNKIFFRLKMHLLLSQKLPAIKWIETGLGWWTIPYFLFFLLTNLPDDFSHTAMVGVGIHIQTSTVSIPGLTTTVPCFEYPVLGLAVLAKVVAAERGRRVESSWQC